MKATLATPGPPGKVQVALSQMGLAVTPVRLAGLVAHAGDASNFTDILVIDPPQWTESGELAIVYAMRFVEEVRRQVRHRASRLALSCSSAIPLHGRSRCPLALS